MGRKSTAREQLIEAAAALFHESGYHAVGVSEICARADVQKGSFYHFFDSKQGLALAVIEAHVKTWRQDLLDLQGGAGPPLERLGRHLRVFHERHDCRCQEGATMLGCPLGNLALELATHDETLRKALRDGLDLQVTAFERVLREARDRGDLAGEIDPAEAAQALVALVEGKLMFAKLHNDASPLASLVDDALRLVGAPASRETVPP